MNYLDEIRNARRVYLIGNGGSYANAVHICNDLLGAGIKAYTLDPATLTATANDHGYDRVFERWIETVGEEGDLLIALSGSGRSVNILHAIAAADRKRMKVIRIFGAPAGLAMQQAEELQLVYGHQWMKALHKNV